MSDARTRIAFLNSHPIQYFAPFYAHLNRSPDIEAVPVYLSDTSLRGALDPLFGQAVKWDIDLAAGSQAIFVPGAGRREINRGFFSIVAPQLFPLILREKFDALVVHGHSYAANFVAILAAKLRGTKVFVRADSHLGVPKSALRRRLRKLVMPIYFQLFSGALAAGTRNAEFYRALGMPARRIHVVPFAVDNERFVAGSTLSPAKRTALRAEYGVTDPHPVIVYAGKFQPLKRVEDIVAAAHGLAAEGLDFHLLLVGSGEMEAALRAQAAAGPARVLFTGFVNQSGLPPLFGSCDIFVLASDIESWGLVVNEAMCAGLPVVVSRECGCTPDLVVAGHNGAAFDARDVRGLTDALRPLIADSGLRTRMGKASRALIAGWSFEQGARVLRALFARP